jgi:hypothetical protein
MGNGLLVLALKARDKKWCIGYCQQFNPAGGRCDPGAAAGTCPLGPQYSTGDCIKATCN